jgi:DNA-binding CsgD family transcriptional regulator
MPNRLSEKQGRCLDLVAQGYTSKEISKMIGVSPYTVDAHIGRAMRTLGTHSRKETARNYLQYKKCAETDLSAEFTKKPVMNRRFSFLQHIAAGIVAIFAASARMIH